MSAKKSNSRRTCHSSLPQAMVVKAARTNECPEEAHDATTQANFSKLEFVVFNGYGFRRMTKVEAKKYFGSGVEEFQ